MDQVDPPERLVPPARNQEARPVVERLLAAAQVAVPKAGARQAADRRVADRRVVGRRAAAHRVAGAKAAVLLAVQPVGVRAERSRLSVRRLEAGRPP